MRESVQEMHHSTNALQESWRDLASLLCVVFEHFNYLKLYGITINAVKCTSAYEYTSHTNRRSLNLLEINIWKSEAMQLCDEKKIMKCVSLSMPM